MGVPVKKNPPCTCFAVAIMDISMLLLSQYLCYVVLSYLDLQLVLVKRGRLVKLLLAHLVPMLTLVPLVPLVPLVELVPMMTLVPMVDLVPLVDLVN